MQRFWKIKKGGKRSFINWNEHRETKNERIGTKTILRVKKEIFDAHFSGGAFFSTNFILGLDTADGLGTGLRLKERHSSEMQFSYFNVCEMD